MRHADAILVSWLVIQVETEQRTCRQLDRSIGERADPELRTLQIGKDRDRPSCFPLDPTNNIVARLMVLMRAMAEVRAKYIRPASNSARISSSSPLAGPNVATILPFR